MQSDAITYHCFPLQSELPNPDAFKYAIPFCSPSLCGLKFAFVSLFLFSPISHKTQKSSIEGLLVFAIRPLRNPSCYSSLCTALCQPHVFFLSGNLEATVRRNKQQIIIRAPLKDKPTTTRERQSCSRNAKCRFGI